MPFKDMNASELLEIEVWKMLHFHFVIYSYLDLRIILIDIDSGYRLLHVVAFNSLTQGSDVSLVNEQRFPGSRSYVIYVST